MSKQYPYLSEEKRIKKPFVCETCKIEKKLGWKLEWEVSWFRGEDEFEKICDECRIKRDTEKKKLDEAYYKKMEPIWKREAEREQNFWVDMKRRLEKKYTVRYLTDYQWRINDTVDIYPTNRRFHNLKTQERGDYQDMHKFLTKVFKNDNDR